jgi:hypothetical protein
MQASKELLARNHFLQIGFGDTGLKLSELFGRETDLVFALASEDENGDPALNSGSATVIVPLTTVPVATLMAK